MQIQCISKQEGAAMLATHLKRHLIAFRFGKFCFRRSPLVLTLFLFVILGLDKLLLGSDALVQKGTFVPEVAEFRLATGGPFSKNSQFLPTLSVTRRKQATRFWFSTWFETLSVITVGVRVTQMG